MEWAAGRTRWAAWTAAGNQDGMPRAKIRVEPPQPRLPVSRIRLYGLAIVACLAGVLSLSADANTFSKQDAEVVSGLSRTAGQLGRDLYQGVKEPAEIRVITECRDKLFINVALLNDSLFSEEILIDLSSRMLSKIDELYVLGAADAINGVTISHANNLRDLANSYIATAGCSEDKFTILKAQGILELVDQINASLPAIGRRARAALRAAESPNMR
jgi:hypothetical protein